MRMLLPLLLGSLLLGHAQGADRLTSRPRPIAPAVKPLAVGDEVRTGSGQRRRAVLPDGSVLYVNQQTSLTVKAARQVSLDKGEVFVEVAAGKDDFTVRAQGRDLATKAGSFAVRPGGALLVTRGSLKVGGLGDPLRAGQALREDAKAPEAAPRGSELLDWTRELMEAAEGRLVPQSEHGGGALVANTPAGEPVKLALRRFHIDVVIEDGFARTTIDQTYFNHHTGRLEGTFYFPLPADASLSQLAMYVDGNLMEGGIVERDYGRSVYERIVQSQQDPALLEWLDGTTFKMRVFPLEPRQEKRLLLSYTQRLSSSRGRLQYRFPAGHSLDAVADWSLAVRVKGGEKLAWKSESHSLAGKVDKGDLLLSAAEKNAKLDRDVVLEVQEPGGDKAGARFSLVEQDGAKYLMVRYRPDWPATARRERRDWVVLCETSGDRNPLLARAQIEVVRDLLQQAEPDDTITVATAATRLNLWKKEAVIATPENVEAAVKWLEQAHLLGALDLGGALTNLEPTLKACKNAHLVHVGCGVPALGERRQDVLAKLLPEGTRYVGVGVGKRWNRALMKQAAERTGGYFTQINPDEAISWRAFELAAALNTPRLLNVKLGDDLNGRWLLDSTILSQGEELCAVARLDAKEPLPKELKIGGQFDDKPFEATLKVEGITKEALYLPRHWARLEIERLLANPDEKTRARVVELSKAMYVMTPYTSLLVLENDDMYTQYKVERNRKDLWAAYPAPKKIEVKTEGPVPAAKPSRQEVLNTILVRGRPAPSRESTSGVKVASTALQFRSMRVDQAVALRGFVDVTGQITGTLTPTGSVPSPRSPVSLDSLGELGMLVKGTTLERAPNSLRSLGVRDSKAASGDDPNTNDEMFATLAAEIPFDPKAKPRKKRVFDAVEPATVITSGRPLADLTEAAMRGDTIHELYDMSQVDSLLYRPLHYRGDDRFFYDLLLYAPGMDTGTADVLAVLENEATETDASKPGKIDDKAQALFDKARQQGWRKASVPGSGESPAFTVTYDAEGRYAYERTLPPGIKEVVVCDGKTLWHLYPDLHLGAKRTVSRFHRIGLASVVPQFVPDVADLAHGADLVLKDDTTAALVPFGAGKKDKEGKVISYVVVEFQFDKDGALAERRGVQMPDKKVLRREVYGKEGVRWLDADGKELAKSAVKVEDGKEPGLKPKLDELVVLDLPYRTPEHVRKATKTEKKGLGELTFAEGLPLLASSVGRRDADGAANVFRSVFAARDQHQLGYYVLLASCGRNLDSQNENVLAQHRHEPLGQYLALYTSPLLREHASQWATGSGQWKDNFMQRLALTHAFLQRWQSTRTLGATDAARSEELGRAIDYIRDHRDSPFAWALLTLMIQRTQDLEREEKDVKAHWKALVGLRDLIAREPEMGTHARYEQARALWKTGDAAEATKVWRALFEEQWQRGALLRIDADLHAAFHCGKVGIYPWNDLLADVGRQALEMKDGRAVLVTFAWQLWQLDDAVGAGRMLELAQKDVKEAKEKETLQLLALQFYWLTRQYEPADRHLRALLADKAFAEDPGLWRFAADVAERRTQPRRRLECLERAANLVAQQGDKADADVQSKLNEGLLGLYEKQAESLLTLGIEPPADFRTKVVRAADRWRAGGGGESACQEAASILRLLGEKDLAWDYLTTPVAERPYESGPWAALARNLIEGGEFGLADKAYAAAFDAERTNAQLLWDRALALRQGGRADEAKKVLRQLAEGDWQPRFRNLQQQAKGELDR